MVTGMKKAMMTLLATVLLAFPLALAIPSLAEARYVHNFYCGQCHKATVSFTELGDGVKQNVCLQCHNETPILYHMNTTNEDLAPQGEFITADASKIFTQTPADSGISHMWAAKSDVNPAAGAVAATTYAAQFNGRYGLSRGKITCARCHNPHGYDTYDKKLLKVANAADEMCKDCHKPWNVANTNASLTHPIVLDYESVANAPANAGKFETAFDPGTGKMTKNVAQGDVRLVFNSGTGKYMVSCSSCHNVHFSDSNSTTADGMANQAAVKAAGGDGKLLRSDGSLRTGVNQNATAQLRSNLCQACHTYKMHGKPTSEEATAIQVGCLDCHGGHAYDPVTPNAFVLRKTVDVPVSPRGILAAGGQSDVALGNYTAPYQYGVYAPWSDRNPGTATGYCEKCHGDVESAPIDGLASGHPTTAINGCNSCHYHHASGWTYSFKPDASAANCGQCHGFPPYLNTRGDRVADGGSGTDGGYAYSTNDTSTTLNPTGVAWNYSSHAGPNQTGSYFKDETQTAHKTHAGGKLTGGQGNPGDWYFVGASGIANCEVCHGAGAGNDARHRNTSSYDSFREIPFAGVATADGHTPSYAVPAWTCSGTYCHTNGGPRDGAGGRTYVAYTSPAWVGNGTTDGFGAITNKGANRCKACHGNDAASLDTVVSGGKGNTAAHQKHVGGPGSTKNYGCNVCHAYTAASKDTLAANASRGDLNSSDPTAGLHVNAAVDVNFDTAFSLGATNLTYNSAYGDTFGAGKRGYAFATGTCSVYCHTDGAGGAPVTTPDWDGTGYTCTSCHKGNVASGTAMSNGSHGQHINGTVATVGRQMGCVECHSTTVSNDTTIGTPANHVNGALNIGIPSNTPTATTCSDIRCHSDGNLDGTITYQAAGQFVWGSSSLTCASCHGNGTVAYPTYANGGGGNANSHVAHSTIACGECHALVSTTGTSIDGSAPANHVNQVVNVNPASVSPKFGTWTDGTKTCSAITCHGGNSAVWGSTSLACGSCHQTAGADVDNFVYNDATQALVSTAEWTFSGHGKTTGTYEVTGRAAANFPGSVSTGDPCKFCHDSSVPHNAANYFRLRQNGKPDLNGVCLGCHETGSAGVDPDGAGTAYNLKNALLAKVDKYHQGAKHGDPRDGGRWCWDCHDPHGDASAAGARIQMIQKRAQVNPNANGVPASLTGTDIVFTSRTTGAGAGGFARDAAPYAAGICNACHTTTLQYTNASGAGTHTTAQCTTCHQHSKDTTYNANAFQGSGCNGCHGSTGTGQYWPDGVIPGNPSIDYADNSVGAHQNHILAISTEIYGLDIAGLLADPATDAKQQAICAFCHKNPGASGHDTNGGGDNRVDVVQDSDDGAGNTDVFRKWGPAANDSASDIDGTIGNQAYNFTNGTCSNLACHDRTVSPASWTTPPATPNCSVCHVAAGNGLGRHDTHVTTKGYACTECHTNVGAFPTATTNLRHANGSVELVWNIAGSFENTYGALPTPGVTYTGGLIYGDASFGTCASAACHNNLTSTAWNAAVSSACAICHTDDNSNPSAVVDPTTGLHNYNATYPDVEGHDGTFFSGGATCISCHNPASISGGHVNGSVTALAAGNLISDATQTIALNGAGAADDTCTADCHNDNNTWARQWSADAYSAATTPGSPRCNVCHGQLNAWVAGLGVNHNLPKINDSTHSACATCHVLPDAPYVWATHHDDGNMNYNSNTDLSYSTTNANCTSACHDNSAPYTMTVSTTFPTTVGLNGSGGGCTLCHGNGSSKIWPDGVASGGTETLRSSYADSAAGAHEKHVQAIGTYLGYGSVTTAYTETQQKTAICVFCHPNPGGAGHSTDNAPLSTVDVLAATQFLKYNGAGGSTTDTASGAYSGGSCATLACHDRAATPASWNSPPAANCSTCHVAAGSSNGRHDTHVTTKGYACTECHPNQGTWPTGTAGLQHANGTVNLAWNVAGSFENSFGGASVTYTGTLVYGDGNFGTCASAACHNNLTSTAWNVAATSACAVCHTDNNSNASTVVDPTSGLHIYNATYPDVEGHDASFTGGGTCTSCHNSASISGGHVNGAVTALVAGNFVSNAGQTINLNGAGTADDTCTANCHIDNNKWARLWDGAAYSAATTSGDPRCNVCHGQFGNWRTGSVHAGTFGAAASTRGQTHNKLTGAANACEDCHSYATQGATKHMNSLLTMNDDVPLGDTDVTVGANGVFCDYCHDDDGLPTTSGTHTFPATTLTVEKIAGANDPEGSCNTCHGDKTTGQTGGVGNNWPDSNTSATYPDIAGTHDEHVSVIASKRATAGTNSCNTCHATADDTGANGTPPASHQPGTAPARVKRMDNTGDGVADLDLVSWRHLLDTGAATDADPVYKYGASGAGPKTCSNIDCHYNVETPTWFGAVLTSSNAPETLTSSVQVRPTAGAWANEITVAAGATIEVQGTIDDTAGGGHVIQSAQYKVDYTGAWTAMNASDGSFNTSSEGAIKTAISTTGWSRGKHIIYVQGKDAVNIAYGPPATAIVNITTPDTLNVSTYSNNGAGLPAATFIKGTHMPMMRLDLSMTNTDGQNATTVTSLNFSVNGTNGAANVGLASLYLDTDMNQAFDPNVDTPIGSVDVTATPFALPVVNTTITTGTQSLFLVFQAASGATAGNTVGATLNSITADADDTVSLAGASPSATGTLQNSVAGNLYVTPSGVSSLGAWSSYVSDASSPGNEATVMDVADTTNYMYTATKNNAMTVDMDNHTTESDTITGVQLTITSLAAAGTSHTVTPRIGTTAGTAMSWTISSTMTARTQSVPRPGGGSWSWADIDNLNFIVNSPNTNGTNARMDKLEINVAYGGVSTSAPITYNVLANGAKAPTVTQGTSFSLAATLNDANGGAHAVNAANYQADTPPSGGSGTAMTLSGSGPYTASATVATTGWAKGNHWVYVYGSDATDGWGNPSAVNVNIAVPDVVTLAGASYPPPAQVGLGEKAAYLSMDFTQNSAGDANVVIDQIKLTKVGTIADAEVKRVAIYDDKGSVQNQWDGDDNIIGIGSFGTPSAGVAGIDLIPNAVVSNGTTTRFYAVLTTSTNLAIGGTTLGVSVDDADITLLAPDTMAATTPFSSATAGIVAGGGAAKCGFCHTIPLATGAHLKHSNTDATYTDCDNCHGSAAYSVSPAVGGGYTSTAPALHNNTGPGSPDMYFSRATPASPTGAWSGTNCTNIECHNGSPTPNWVGGTVTCTSCHNNGTNDGALENAHPGTGKHALHVNNSAYLNDCVECHGVGANNGTHNGHRNGVANFSQATGGLYLSAYASGTDDCTNTCHNVPTNSWNGASKPWCTDCHAAGKYAPVPGSGLHAVTVAMAHDASFQKGTSPTYTCEGCHNSAAGISDVLGASTTITHRNGTTEASNLVDYKWTTNITSYSQANGCAAACHNDAIGGVGKWQRKWNGVTDATPLNTMDPGHAVCDNCHGDGIDSTDGLTLDGVWRGGMVVNHEANPDGNSGTEIMANHQKCELCHGYGHASYDKTYETGNHGNDLITMNGPLGTGAGYDAAAWNCTAACHTGAANNAHMLSDSTRPLQYGNFGSGSCTSCHGGGSPAAGVSEASSHTTITTYLCQDCHGSHTTGTVVVANKSFLGINYTANGETGINLRDPVGSATTEAEICWNCHLAKGVSEWGTGPGRTYNFGSITPNGNWVGATWQSADQTNFSYKNGPIASIHEAKGITAVNSYTRSDANTVGNIGCSYCHNVHNGTNGDGVTKGKPYLRGTWIPNRYKEDGAPRGAITYTAPNSYGAVPRASTTSDAGKGGWQIDQNNGNPNSAVTNYTQHAGICQTCHGTVANIEARWAGHINPVAGGTNSTLAARNIFKKTRNGNGTWNGGMWMGAVGSTYQSGTRGGSYRNTALDSNGVTPYVVNQAYAYNSFAWTGVTMDDTTVNTNFHNFTCSKCHNPHASRLPRLMITNCLDVNHNTWDDQFQANANMAKWSGGAIGNVNRGTKEHAYSSTAQNCHRYVDVDGPGGAAPTENGWNQITPWREFDPLTN